LSFGRGFDNNNLPIAADWQCAADQLFEVAEVEQYCGYVLLKGIGEVKGGL